jgi:hypothetical protein
MPCLLNGVDAYDSFLTFLGAPSRWQAFKTRAQVGDWLDRWATENLADADSDDKELFHSCIKNLKKLNGDLLLEHVTKVCKSDEEFNKTWTKRPTHLLGSSLYIRLCEWLGAGKSDLS